MLRRLLLEFWALLALGAIVGFVGPFGTYTQEVFASRVGHWSFLLAEAYLVVRPGIFLLGVLSRATGLPQGALQFWGTWLCAAPLVVIWRLLGDDQVQVLADFAVLLPTSLLCSIAILGVTRWAESTDLRITGREAMAEADIAPLVADEGVEFEQDVDDTAEPQQAVHPALAGRLLSGAAGPILALQSEDHYVRVHTAASSELVLMRLRDAIAEMKGIPGEQVHRSWWVAQAGIAEIANSGRSRVIHLTNGKVVPIARDSLARLQRTGFLPRDAGDLNSV